MSVTPRGTKRRSRRRIKPRPPTDWTPFASPEQLRETFGRLMGLRNVWGCFIGQKKRRGKTLPGPALVCVVSSKVPRKKLTRKDLVPASVPFALPHQPSLSLPTDVVQCTKRFRTQQAPTPPPPVVGPGDRVVRANGETGTIGLVLRRLGSDVRVLTTAGHVFKGAQPNELVRVVNASGAPSAWARLVQCRLTEKLDYALLRLEEGGTPANLYADAYPIHTTYEPNPSIDVGATLWVLRTTGGATRVLCRGLHGIFQLPNGGTLQDVILTDAVTAPGDSGCPLVDPQRRAWGLLRGVLNTGTFRVSVFSEASDLLVEEQAQLA
jgi:Trypsin-like peptidase domain